MIRVGISGWNYAGWRKRFYPEGLSHREELAYCGSAFASIEINGSFYSLQRPSSYARWYEATPPGFVFAVKGGRFITHMKKLRDVETATANFFASGLLRLREKLGPILWQFPASLGLDEGRFREFFELLPFDTRAAARLARRHDDKLARPEASYTRADAQRPIRHAVEVRHPSFDTKRFYDLCARHDVAVVVADTAGKFPFLDRVTASFVYVRLHGDTELYTSGYSPEAIASWAGRVRTWARGGRDVYVYFDNDAKVRAPFDALALASAVGSPGVARDVLRSRSTEVTHEHPGTNSRTRRLRGPRAA